MSNPGTPDNSQRKSFSGMRSSLALGLAFIVGIFVFIVTFKIVTSFQQPRQELIPASQRVPAQLSMPTLDGGGVWSLADHHGKVVIVNYFATWCVPCREEMPTLIKIASDYASRGVETVALSLDNDADDRRPFMDALKEFQSEVKPPFPILVPPRDSPLFTGEVPLPQTFLIDKHGRTAQQLLGQIDEKSLRTSIETLRAEN